MSREPSRQIRLAYPSACRQRALLACINCCWAARVMGRGWGITGTCTLASAIYNPMEGV